MSWEWETVTLEEVHKSLKWRKPQRWRTQDCGLCVITACTCEGSASLLEEAL